MIVSVVDFWPGESGRNSTVSLHFLRGSSCAVQVVLTGENSELAGAIVVIGRPKVIGGPFLAELRSVSVADLTPPTLTLPKPFGEGVTLRRSGTGVDVGVAVGVSLGVAITVPVAVAVGDAVRVAVAVVVGVAVGVAVAV
jgi:hypothetical protein